MRARTGGAGHLLLRRWATSSSCRTFFLSSSSPLQFSPSFSSSSSSSRPSNASSVRFSPPFQSKLIFLNQSYRACELLQLRTISKSPPRTKQGKIMKSNGAHLVRGSDGLSADSGGGRGLQVCRASQVCRCPPKAALPRPRPVGRALSHARRAREDSAHPPRDARQRAFGTRHTRTRNTQHTHTHNRTRDTHRSDTVVRTTHRDRLV